MAQAFDQWLHHPQVALDNAGSCAGGAVQLCRLRSLGAFGIAIEALAGLAAETTGVHQFFLHQRRLEAEVTIEGIEHRAGDGVIDVVADQVGELERAHAETTGITQQRIEAGAISGTFLQQAQAFGIERPRHTVNDETRRGARMHRLLAPGLGGGIDARGNGPIGRKARDHLDQGHERCRVEEVHANHLLGALQTGSDAGDGQRRGVAGEDTVGSAQGFKLAEQRLFDRQVLDDGFYHQAGISQCLKRINRAQANTDRFTLSGLQLAFFHQPGQLAVNARHCLGGGTRAVVVELYRVPGLGRDLGNTGPHRTGTDHRHLHIACECGHVQRPLKAGVRLFMKALTPSR
ncbi:hypothetical protein D3C76_910600 [compost metagenome]